MAATGYSPIQLYYSTTASAAPTAGNLASGELAINITDGKLYYKDNAGAVQLLSTSTTANGTANGVLYLNGSKVATAGSVLVFDGTSLGVGVTPSAKLDVSGASGGIVYVRGTGDAYQEITGGGRTPGTGSLLVGQGNAGEGYLWNRFNSYLAFGVNNSEAMRLTSTGLGIGTSSPFSKLDIKFATDKHAIFTASAAYSNSADLIAVNDAGSEVALGLGGSTVRFYTGATERMRLDTSGNLGLGVTPSAWNGGYKVMQIGAEVVMYSGTGGFSGFNGWGSNFYIDSAGDTRYIRSSYANIYQQNRTLGVHAWYNAPSGNASDVVTFTQAMTLNASGNLGIGTTSPAKRLHLSAANDAASLDLENTAGSYFRIIPANPGVDNTGLSFYDVTNSATRMRIDSSGNLGLGVTPSAWVSPDKVIQFGNGNASIGTQYSGDANFMHNAYESFPGTFKYIQSAGAPRYQLDLNNNAHKWYTAPSGTAGAAITFTQAMTLDASGNLALGTTSSLSSASNRVDLTINGASTAMLTFGVGAVRKGFVIQDATDMTISNEVAGALVLKTNATERARIDSSGNLLVGTTSALDGPARIAISVTSGQPDAIHFKPTSNVTYYPEVYINSSGTTVGYIQATSTLTVYATTSDYRLKDNQQPLTGSGAFIDALQPKTWNWKADGSRGVGFIAHEVQEVSPGSVVGEKDGEQMQAMEYGSAEFIANIIAELQSLRKRLADAGIA